MAPQKRQAPTHPVAGATHNREPQTAPLGNRRGSFLGHDDQRASFTGREPLTVEYGARVLGVVAVQCRKFLCSLGQSRHQHSESGFIAADPVAFQIHCRERLEHVGCGLSAFDHKRSDRAEAVPKKRMTAPAATPEEGLAEVPVNEPYIANGQTVAFSGKVL
jgi:hypothetical protein